MNKVRVKRLSVAAMVVCSAFTAVWALLLFYQCYVLAYSEEFEYEPEAVACIAIGAVALGASVLVSVAGIALSAIAIKSVFDRSDIIKNSCIAFSVICPLALILNGFYLYRFVALTAELINNSHFGSFWTVGRAATCLIVCAVIVLCSIAGIVLCALKLKKIVAAEKVKKSEKDGEAPQA